MDPYQEKAEKLQAFKDWVHRYLDNLGVPHHPPGTHGAEGCRIGDRMDWLVAKACSDVRQAALDAEKAMREAALEAIREEVRLSAHPVALTALKNVDSRIRRLSSLVPPKEQ